VRSAQSLANRRVKGLLVLHVVRWQGLSDQSARHLRKSESRRRWLCCHLHPARRVLGRTRRATGWSPKVDMSVFGTQADSTADPRIALRPLTKEEKIIASGCVQDDWQSFRSANGSISAFKAHHFLHSILSKAIGANQPKISLMRETIARLVCFSPSGMKRTRQRKISWQCSMHLISGWRRFELSVP
jgi:hypothetical protein